MTNSVFGMAESEDVARKIVEDLKSDGIIAENISALFPEKKASREFSQEQNTKMPEGAATGAGVDGSRRSRSGAWFIHECRFRQARWCGSTTVSDKGSSTVSSRPNGAGKSVSRSGAGSGTAQLRPCSMQVRG